MDSRDIGIAAGQAMNASPRSYTIGALRELEDQFTHHAPKDDQLPRYHAIRAAGHALASAILTNCPPGADRSDAIRKVREACMTANAAIAIGEANKL